MHPPYMAEEKSFVFHGLGRHVELSIKKIRDLADRWGGDSVGLYALAMAPLFGWNVDQDRM